MPLGWVGWLASLAGCTSQVLLSSPERLVLERQLLSDNHQFLRVSMNVMPFFGDAKKRLVHPLPPEEIRLVDHPTGQPASPGAIEKIFPAGTPVEITAVEFPTAFTYAERIPYTPRHQPWVYLKVPSDTDARSLVLVLRPKIRDRAEFLADLERYLSVRNLEKTLNDFDEAVRRAVRLKGVVPDMPSPALEMAWGYPERKRLSFEGPNRSEEWWYPGNRRTAYLVNGRVARIQGDNWLSP